MSSISTASSEDAHWRAHYKSRPYVEDTACYEDFGPAYAFGHSLYSTCTKRSLKDVDMSLAHDWEAARGTSTLSWDRALCACRDAWQRLHESRPRDPSSPT